MIDFRSDTVTQPTPEMRTAMADAPVGDDIYGDDPTVIKLESMAAERVGMEAALFVPSGIMGNQLAIMAACKRGDEIIIDVNSHIYLHEVGAAAVLSGVSQRTLNSERGMMDIGEIESSIRGEDLHYPETRMICLENAHSTGTVAPLSYMKSVYRLAETHNLHLHLDGARLFNAATSLNCDPRHITENCDSVMFCVSKGLCAPVGSLLCGSKAFIERARKMRRLLGGSMRQAGIIAAAGIVALTNMVGRLREDHANAQILAHSLASIDGFKVNTADVMINMVFADISNYPLSADKLHAYLFENGVNTNPAENHILRLVTHHGISVQDIGYLSGLLSKLHN